jgi:hypothetical protein
MGGGGMGVNKQDAFWANIAHLSSSQFPLRQEVSFDTCFIPTWQSSYYPHLPTCMFLPQRIYSSKLPFNSSSSRAFSTVTVSKLKCTVVYSYVKFFYVFLTFGFLFLKNFLYLNTDAPFFFFLKHRWYLAYNCFFVPIFLIKNVFKLCTTNFLFFALCIQFVTLAIYSTSLRFYWLINVY